MNKEKRVLGWSLIVALGLALTEIFLLDSAVGEYSSLMQGVFGDEAVHVLRIRPLGTLHLNTFFV
jgi:hypothetical protein